MSLNKKEIKRGSKASSSLKCCQVFDSMTSLSATDQGIVCEAMNNFVVNPSSPKEVFNNNYSFHTNTYENKHEFPKRPPADLKFENITYSSTTWSLPSFKSTEKKILHGISGEFKCGELSAIMGPSGSGKTTLLNILAGFTTKGSSGGVYINDVLRDHSHRFRKLAAYIPQEEELRLGLTVIENMTIAAHLKLGYSVSLEYKLLQVIELLELLGLEECQYVRTSRLSGGQQKRLAIALELLSNPPILFLDEPTTGLDSLSSIQCVSLLKRLAQEGRTVICTIHQPSALIFEMFDQLYALSAGKCIYQGSIQKLIPHLATFGLYCPSYHNPADFLMEIAAGEHEVDLDRLSNSNRPEENQDKKALMTMKEKELFTKENIDLNNIGSSPPASEIMQFLLLYKRNLLTAKRNYMFFFNRILAHILIGLIFGYLYIDVGAGANTVLANYVYLYGSMLLIVYTGKMSVTLSFPLEMKVLTREHFNRWYNLTPYLLSVLLIEIPFQIFCSWTYIGISYWLTSQPFGFRFYLFVILCTLSTLCAQAWGYFIGATTPTKIAVFLGPVIACLFSIFGFCIRYKDTPTFFRWLYHLSYYRAGFQSAVYVVYGLDRHDLVCPDNILYCHYLNPTKFLQEMDITDVNIASNMSLIIVIGCLMHTLTYITLWFKLNKR